MSEILNKVLLDPIRLVICALLFSCFLVMFWQLWTLREVVAHHNETMEQESRTRFLLETFEQPERIQFRSYIVQQISPHLRQLAEAAQDAEAKRVAAERATPKSKTWIIERKVDERSPLGTPLPPGKYKVEEILPHPSAPTQRGP